MVVNRPSDFFRLALSPCIQSTNNSLQFRKLMHHFSYQVALRQFSSAVRARHIRLRNPAAKPLLREPAGQIAHPFYFVAIASQTRFICHCRKPRKIITELPFLIRLPEKLRIRKTRAQNALVSRANQPLRVAWQVNHSEKMRCELPVPRLQAEILLVVSHHRNQNLIWKRKECRIEVPHDHAGKFVKVCHEIEQSCIIVHAQLVS